MPPPNDLSIHRINTLFAVFLINLCFLTDKMNSLTFISDEQIKGLLNWDILIPAVEEAIGAFSRKEVIQPPRLFMPIPSKDGVLLALPAFSGNQQALGCKVVTSFRGNEKKGLPSILATILFLDPDTGKLKVVMEGTEITTWRTAATTVVATKNLHRGGKKVLAILGAGVQGRIHAIAMKHFFNFDEVRIWNRTPQRAKKLCEELGPWAVHYTSNEECVKGADVIVTVTNSPSPIVMKDWVKTGAHINVIGSSSNNHHSEIDDEIYKSKSVGVFVDQMETALQELKDLVDDGVKLVAEVGDVINKNVTIKPETEITLFQSLGMAIEDVIAAKVVYESYLKEENKTAIM